MIDPLIIFPLFTQWRAVVTLFQVYASVFAKLKRGAEEVVVPKDRPNLRLPRLVQLLKVAGRSGLYHPLNKADIKMMLTFGSKEQHTNRGITS